MSDVSGVSRTNLKRKRLGIGGKCGQRVLSVCGILCSFRGTLYLRRPGYILLGLLGGLSTVGASGSLTAAPCIHSVGVLGIP